MRHGQAADRRRRRRSPARSRISGAKNAALPILCAALLTRRAAARCTNVPRLNDVAHHAGAARRRWACGVDARRRGRGDARRRPASTIRSRPTNW
ncbi:MAG: hypothetical protein MZW92_18110 [Comamonadaceae bacterium]|nr:hypothetical protein [Comamonadaceae bacterium]